MPSNMQGFKTDAEEGGWRNFLAIKGPGITPGSIDSTLTNIADVVPTVLDLAGGSPLQHLSLDGISLINLMAGVEPTDKQEDRFVITIGPDCAFWPDLVPLVGPHRCEECSAWAQGTRACTGLRLYMPSL